MRVVRLVAVLGVCLTILAADAAGACQSDPACSAARYRATATHFAALVRCRMRPLDRVQACNAAAYAALQRDLGRTDGRRGCSIAEDAPTFASAVSRTQDEALPPLLGFVDASSRCSKRRWTAVVRFARNLLAAHARDVIRPDGTRLAAARDGLEAQLARALVNALRAGDCNGGSGDTAAVSAAVRRSLVEEACPVCGNGVRGGAEQCDASDGPCPGQCASDCTCPAGGFCGDGRVDPGEECDGTDVAGCSVSGYPQCGAPGRTDQCRCSGVPVDAGACGDSPPPVCPAGTSCATLAQLTPVPEIVHACVAPEPASCGVAEDCRLAADACRDGSCCATLGGACSTQNPCCSGTTCGPFGSGEPAVCCRAALQPCERNADCCQGLCEIRATGNVCAFF